MYRVKYAAGDGTIQTVMKTEDLEESHEFKQTVNAVLQGKAYIEHDGKRITDLQLQFARQSYKPKFRYD